MTRQPRDLDHARVAGGRDSALNCRLRLMFAAIDDARRESSREEWETFLLLLEQRLIYIRHRDRLAA